MSTVSPHGGAIWRAGLFERRYAARSGMTVGQLRALGRTVRPCRCGASDCEGLMSVSLASARDEDVAPWRRHWGVFWRVRDWWVHRPRLGRSNEERIRVDMGDPMVCKATERLVLRLLPSQGFQLETTDGHVIFRCSVPFEHGTFRVTPGPPQDTATVTVEAAWIESWADKRRD